MARKKRKQHLARAAPLLLSSAPMCYRFATCELDARLYQLRRDGTPVAIEPRVFDVLVYLLHHRDRVVPKDELLNKLWPGQVVTETALTRCIVAARKAVGDDGAKQAIIETQHGRGYRFVATVTEQSEAPTARPLSDGVSSSVTVTSNGQAGEPIAMLPSLLDGQATNKREAKLSRCSRGGCFAISARSCNGRRNPASSGWHRLPLLAARGICGDTAARWCHRDCSALFCPKPPAPNP